MASITIKNVPENVYERLKKQAKLHHRSLNSEIIYNLEKSVGLGNADQQELLQKLADFRERIAKRGMLTNEEIERHINEGRP